MSKKKVIKSILILAGIGIVIAGAVVLYMFNQPHRDVQSLEADFSYNASDIVSEYLKDANTANEKYLDAEGESKILQISGTIAEISKDFNDQTVILLKTPTDKAGVSCTLTKETEASAEGLAVGDKTTIKGVIRAGASYDEDLEMYENVIIEKSKVVK